MDYTHFATVAAICTPQGLGGIGIIRISGAAAPQIADTVFVGKQKPSAMQGYTAALGQVQDKNETVLDQCIVTRFCAPKSYTGEEVVELSCHGGSYVLRRVLEAVYAAGATPAPPGEFTKRAFLNGKLDLAQAEGIMALIAAGGERAREAALAGQGGALSQKIGSLREKLVRMGADLSAWADYPDDDIPQVDQAMLKTTLQQIEAELTAFIQGFANGKIYRDGVNTVIAGRPNAGKSTLMNLLAGCERSIVTPVAGTTRDVIEERVMLGEIPLILADTAGIRHTNDPVEAIGVQRALARMGEAELILAVFDSSIPLAQEDEQLIAAAKGRPAIGIINKTDLHAAWDSTAIAGGFSLLVDISARSGVGLAALTKAVAQLLGAKDFVAGTATLCTQRQQLAVQRALQGVIGAREALQQGMTLDAVTVMTEAAVGALLELTGERVSDVLVDSVFERFCVGK